MRLGARIGMLGPLPMLALAGLLSSCTPVSKAYEIHTNSLSCDEANRFVYDALVGMKMTVTGFRPAKMGSPGFVRASRTDSTGTLAGTVHITCDAAGTHIVTDEEGLGTEQQLKRGVYLSVTGRAGLHKAEAPASGGSSTTAAAAGTVASASGGPAAEAPAPSRPSSGGGAGTPLLERTEKPAERKVGVSIALTPIEGFATVLDFDADVSRAGILPIKVSIVNATNRSYEFDPRDIVLRVAGSRTRAKPLTAAEAVALLATAARKADESAGEGEGGASELGDVASASKRIEEQQIRAARLRPGDHREGYLYYPSGSYDRARVTMIDVATGETEGFLVEF